MTTSVPVRRCGSRDVLRCHSSVRGCTENHRVWHTELLSTLFNWNMKCSRWMSTLVAAFSALQYRTVVCCLPYGGSALFASPLLCRTQTGVRYVPVWYPPKLKMQTGLALRKTHEVCLGPANSFTSGRAVHREGLRLIFILCIGSVASSLPLPFFFVLTRVHVCQPVIALSYSINFLSLPGS